MPADCSIINGFALPLKEEHKQFLKRSLLPLLSLRTLPLFYQALSYAIMQFIEKEPPLAPSVIRIFLRFWPKTSCAKEVHMSMQMRRNCSQTVVVLLQVIFLAILEEMLDVTPIEQLADVMRPLCAKLASAIASEHFQVKCLNPGVFTLLQ